MNKDHFYYVLKDRLEYANDYLKDSSTWLRSVEFQNKVDDEEGDQEDIISLLKILEETILNKVILSGIPKIVNASMSKYDHLVYYDNESNNYIKKSEWVLDTTGSNLLDIFNHPAVDVYKTVSNDIHEVMNIFGIEAARTLIINEIRDIFEQSSSYVNFRHLSLLADIMTNKGYIMSVDRHGINKSNRGPLAKCSFEETPDIILKAALFGEVDNVKGVSSNIMLGQEPPIGTGSIDILFDEEKYFESIIEMEYHREEEAEQKVEVEDITNYDEKKLLRKVCHPGLFTDNLFNNI